MPTDPRRCRDIRTARKKRIPARLNAPRLERLRKRYMLWRLIRRKRATPGSAPTGHLSPAAAVYRLYTPRILFSETVMPRLLLIPAAALFVLSAGCTSAESNAVADSPRAVSVSGQGEVRAAPDMATLEFGIEARGKDLPALQTRAGRTMADFLALCGTLGMPDNQVQTSQLMIEPRYHWDEGRQIFDGYQVVRMITVRLEALDQLGTLIEQAVALGVNTVSPPQL